MSILSKIAFAIATVVIAAPAAAAQAGPPSVILSATTIVGRWQGPIATYLGVPYAAPPINELRFRSPQPVSARPHVLLADKTPNACPQSTSAGASIEMSEDCLRLNIFAPRGHSSRPRPVIVWIHGGGFTEGSISAPQYDGSHLAERSDAVVVSVNYRLGVLGFLGHPALDAESPYHTSGNYGFQDQQEALRWIKANIRAFDGDPSDVTIVGQSAGGFAVINHLVAPGSRGLFHRAILTSTTAAAPGPVTTLKQNEQQAITVVRQVGCEDAADVAACIRHVPVSKLLSFSFLIPTAAAFVPMIVQDGVFIPVEPLRAISSGRFNQVPVIVGTTEHDLDLLVSGIEGGLGRRIASVEYEKQLGDWFGRYAPEVRARYPLGEASSAAQALSAAFTDGLEFYSMEVLRRALEKYVDVYAFEFTQSPAVQAFPLDPVSELSDTAAHHGSELPYVFGVDRAGNALGGQHSVLSQMVMSYYAAMARTGNPNAQLRAPAVQWPRYNGSHRTLALQAIPYVSTTAQASHRFEFWNAFPVTFPSLQPR
jgi:para-nitrobenzyl esterase